MRDHLIIGTNILGGFPPKHLIKSGYNQKMSVYTISHVLSMCDLDPNYKMTLSANRLAVFLSSFRNIQLFHEQYLLLFAFGPLSLHWSSCLLSSSLSFQEEKDSDSTKETLDDLFPDDQDDQAPGSKCCTSSSSFCFERLSLNFLSLDPNMKYSFWAWDVDFSGTLFINS